MTCHIIVRETLDWHHASYEQLASPFIQEMARLWDRTFRVGFMACRARIKDIAQRTHRDLVNTRLVDAGCPDAFDVRSVRPDDMVLLCDDDDWYAPSLGAQLAARTRPRDRIAIWPDAVFGFWFDALSASSALQAHFEDGASLILRLREREIDTKSSPFAIRTNNYAVPGALLHQRPDLLEKMWGHVGADTLVKREKLPTTRFSRMFSIANRHPCSHLVLANLMKFATAYGREDPATTLRTFVRSYAGAAYPELPRDAQWAESFIRRTRAVFREACG